MRVCMFSFTECDQNYNTVRRVTRALHQAGHDVRVVALLGRQSAAWEESDGATIVRVALDPVNHKIMRLVDLPLRIHRQAVALLARGRFPRTLGERERLGARTQGRQSAPVARIGEYTGLAGSAFKENPAYFLAAAWLLALAYGVIVWPVTKVYRRLRNSLARRIRWGTINRYCLYVDYYYRSFRLARREPFDVFHAHDLPTLPVAWLCARVQGAKLIYDSHELWLDRGRDPQRSRLNRCAVKRIESFLITRADASIIPGLSSCRELVTKYHVPPPLVVLNAPFYVNVERSSLFRDELGIPKEERILLYMGRVSAGRGIEEQVLALKYLSNCSLVVFGSGPDRYVSGLRDFISREGLAERTYFFGAVPFEDVPRYAASADIGFVLHKNLGLNYYYVTPNKLFECMMAGLPIVGSNFPDLRWFIEGLNVGVTCDPDKPADIAAAVNRILDDDGLRGEMRRNALVAARTYNWENEAKKIAGLYEGLGS